MVLLFLECLYVLFILIYYRVFLVWRLAKRLSEGFTFSGCWGGRDFCLPDMSYQINLLVLKPCVLTNCVQSKCTLCRNYLIEIIVTKRAVMACCCSQLHSYSLEETTIICIRNQQKGSGFENGAARRGKLFPR